MRPIANVRRQKEKDRKGEGNLRIERIKFIAHTGLSANNALFVHGRALGGEKLGVAGDPGANLPSGKFKWKRGTGVGG
jgi:hypothetical protein